MVTMKKYDRASFLTKSEVKRKRSWTDAHIKRFMPAPDKTKRNPHYSGAARVCLYSVARVNEIEATSDFKKAMNLTAKRRHAMKTAIDNNERKPSPAMIERQETLEWAYNLKCPQLPPISEEQLRKRAIKHYNYRNRFILGSDALATENDSAEFLARITVNYVRHQMTWYDTKLLSCEYRVGGKNASIILRSTILLGIAQQYPHLAEECNRQLDIAEMAEACR